MRLLNIRTLEFKEFYGQDIPPYAITSHRWTDDEVSFKDFTKERKPESKGCKKIEGFCSYITKDNERLLTENPSLPVVEWIWVDTCCIDNRSSAEVSESINSMFQWYSQARKCIAYLADVRPLSQGWENVMDDFRLSEWFRRGWTLQELLAPRCVIFLTSGWDVIGHKCSFCLDTRTPCAGAGPLLNQQIVQITGIEFNILTDYSKGEDVGIEEKLKWMENRATTKPEDIAYCLLGLFDVNMPLLYGEGHKALLRLGEQLDEAMRRRQSNLVELQFGREPGSVPLTGVMPYRSDLEKPSPRTQTASYNSNDVVLAIPASDAVEQPDDTHEPLHRYRPYNYYQLNSLHSHLHHTCQVVWPSSLIKSSSLLMRMIEQTKPPAPEMSARQVRTRSALYYCCYQPCVGQSKAFKRKAALERHIAAMHVRTAESMIDCAHPGCHRRGDYGFIRRDKMLEHMQLVHTHDLSQHTSVLKGS